MEEQANGYVFEVLHFKLKCDFQVLKFVMNANLLHKLQKKESARRKSRDSSKSVDKNVWIARVDGHNLQTKGEF